VTEPVYLDHAATSFPKAPGVVQAVGRCLEAASGNPGRGGHRLTIAATRIVEDAREAVALILGADPERTMLGPGATFWLNTVFRSMLRVNDRVVTSALEHNAVMRPLRTLEHEMGLEVVSVRGRRPTGVPNPDELAAVVGAAPTRMVVITQASNVTGAVLPVADIARKVAPVPVVVDGAQTAGALPVDFSQLAAAAFVCSGHKGLLGPSGTGVLLLSPDFELTPLVFGGTGSRSESEEMPDALPDLLEAGTPNVPGVAGLGAACRWLRRRSVEEIHAQTTALARGFASQLRDIPGAVLPGDPGDGERVGIVSFRLEGCDTAELATWLDRERGFMLRAGLHCAPAAHRRLGTFPEGTLRVGIGPMTEPAHLEQLLVVLREAISTTCRSGISRSLQDAERAES